MSATTANLQSPTVKQLSTALNVSERLVYMSMAINRLRPDLGDLIMAGTMSTNQAYRIATGKAKATSWDRLLAAWNSATEADRKRLLDLVSE